MMRELKERMIRAGAQGGLMGIVTEPSEMAPDRPLFLLLNAGVIHRVGPNRLYVTLSRQLAQLGFWACRFDVSGLGDSVARQDGSPYREARLSDTREMMDLLRETTGVGRFVVLGLCSGADHAFRVALADSRVAGSAMLDGYVYPTRAYTLSQYGRDLWSARKRLLDVGAWKRVARGRHPAWRTVRAKLDGHRDTRFVMDVPPRHEAEEGVRRLKARGVHLLFVYTHGHVGLYESGVRAGAPFPPAADSQLIRVLCIPECDHEFTLLTHQARLFQAIGEWAETVWPLAVRRVPT